MIFQKIQEFIAEQLSIDKNNIKLESDLKEDLGIDSIDAVGLIIKIEEFFKLEVSDETLQKFKNVKDILEYIQQHVDNYDYLEKK
ncbi:Acyl carrier protein [Candidatus Phytoplasma mali]|uniref:Acyl carrier protein n=1 Tax=Phytoplasma mali (strain AT) TaxID=482235 RepID=ACP_PHYMT|nr:acyl carrier protein [Candidatus Phytoplasma mali]B3R0P8.1 RecName: Full=Acyl carrier protein; Short=ACP [Candidatus Phytoplasma mali AT]CAP18632.1 Acyl carrier protein [Candidatus Phytoplasma mali]